MLLTGLVVWRMSRQKSGRFRVEMTKLEINAGNGADDLGVTYDNPVFARADRAGGGGLRGLRRPAGQQQPVNAAGPPHVYDTVAKQPVYAVLDGSHQH